MLKKLGSYEIDDDPKRLDLDRVHKWLASAYWSAGIARELVERSAGNSSLNIGAYDGAGQVAYARVVSDRSTFAWLCDVYVDEAHRRRGLARSMVAFALAHPDHQRLRRWLLATRDAHGIYQQLGFVPLSHPERWMNLACK
jgi:GNAT superfamily N-acetyltransferase